MSNAKKTILVLVSIMLVLSIAAGCSSQKNEMSKADIAPAEHDFSESSQGEKASADFESNSPLEPDKVITTMDLQFETTEFDKSNEELNKIIEKYQGYVEYSNISFSSKSYRNGDYVIRIPKGNVQNFKNNLNTIGNKTRESINKQDVTKQYTDTESRLRVLEVKEERILALIEEATKIEDIIALESQLSEIIYEKEKLQSSLMDLDDKIDFTTINLYLREVDKTTSMTGASTTFGTKVIDAIGNSMYFFKNTLQQLIILIIYLLPFIIVLGVIGFFAYKIMIKYRKNK